MVTAAGTRRNLRFIDWLLFAKRSASAAARSAVRCKLLLGRAALPTFFLPLLLPLYDPLAMRVATHHVFGKFERKFRVQTFGSPVTPSLMPFAAGIKVDALFLPPLVPRTLSGSSHTSVLASFNDFEHKLRSHRSLSKEVCDRFDIRGRLSGQFVGISKLLNSSNPFCPSACFKAWDIAMYAPVNPPVAISHLDFSGILSIVLAIEIISFCGCSFVLCPCS
jgi:hypothetical protein